MKPLEIVTNDEHISKEEAQIIKTQIMSGVAKLMKAGVATDELDERKVQEPRRLLSPEPKLLTVLDDSDEGVVPANNGEETGGTKQDFGGLSLEEIEKLRNLVRKDDDENNDDI